MFLDERIDLSAFCATTCALFSCVRLSVKRRPLFPGVRRPHPLRDADRHQPKGQQHVRLGLARQNRQGLFHF